MELTSAGHEARAAYARNLRSNETEEHKRHRLEYLREWRRKNKDKVKAAQIRYWNKKAADLETKK